MLRLQHLRSEAILSGPKQDAVDVVGGEAMRALDAASESASDPQAQSPLATEQDEQDIF